MNRKTGLILLGVILALAFGAGTFAGYCKGERDKFREAYIANVAYSNQLQFEIDSLNKQIIAQGEFIAELKVLPDLVFTQLGEFEATHYAYGSRTKSGTVPAVGRTVAVDPEVIPIGSVLYIEGYGLRIAEDTGGLISGNIIDVYVASREEALALGRVKALKIWLVEAKQ